MTRTDAEQSRRSFLRSVAVGSAAVGTFTAVSFAQDDEGGDEIAETFVLSGVTSAWQGVAPEEIAEAENPTLELQAGETYRLLWRNGDGQPHNFAILDADGGEVEALRVLDVEESAVEGVFNGTTNVTETNLTAPVNETDLLNATGNATAADEPIGVTELINEEGAAQLVEFEATEEMAEYYCEVHPNTMRGEVSLVEGDGGN